MERKGKVVYLLGAGAMLDFKAPSTSALTTKCEEIIMGKEPYGKEIIKNLNTTFPTPNEGSDKTSNSGYNFETIIAYVEYLLDWCCSKDVIGGNVSSRSIISSVFKTNIERITGESMYELYRELINAIIDEIQKYDNPSLAEVESIRSSWKNHLINVSKQYEKVKIYSLNYDRLTPEIMDTKPYEGTSNTSGTYSRFDYNIKKFRESEFTYFNLHGSIYLKQEPNLLYEVVLQSGTILETSLYAAKSSGGNPNESKIFSPIITGYSKSQRVLSEPFNLGFTSFCSDCDDCDKLVVIGYSFSDPHINSILKKFVFDKEKPIDIVDFSDSYESVERNLTKSLIYILNFKSKGNDIQKGESDNHKINISAKGFSDYLEEVNKQN